MIQFSYQYKKFKVKHAIKIKKWLLKVATGEKKKIDSVQYIFVSDDDLLAINKSALHHDYYTDIITFPYNYQPIHSEIFISIDRVKDHARIYGVSTEHELHRVMVHGLLHMCGYNDKTKVKKKQMTEREDYWLSKRQ